MATWRGNVPDPWPGEQQRSPQVREDALHENGDSVEDLLETADLIGQAEAALAPAETTEASGSAEERLHIDQLVVRAVLEQGLDGSRHRELQIKLIEYAVPVLKKLLVTGEIIAKCSKLNRWKGDADGLWEFTDRDRDELAHDMIAEAMPVFISAVFEERRWSPARGASLKTYFVNACIMQFSSLYRKWWENRRQVRPMGLQVDPDLSGGGVDPAVAVAAADEARRMLEGIKDPQVQRVLALRAIGYSADSAAREAGLTPKAAEGRMTRLRKGLRKDERPAKEDENGEGKGRFQ